jgi:hypothetical protein
MNRLDVLLSLLALGLGFCLSRISLCAVAATKSLVLHRRGTAVAGLAVAASASGLVLITLSLSWPSHPTLPADMPVSGRIVAGGVLLGLGALINGGCYLGSISYLGTGNINFLFTLLGIGLSARWTGLTMRSPIERMAGKPDSWVMAIGLFGFLAVLLLAWRSRRDAASGIRFPLLGAWPWQHAAACCGVIAALLFAYSPYWTYGIAIEALARVDSRPLDWRQQVPAVATFLGVGAGALLGGRFALVRPALPRALRCLLGGAVMGYGASRIPGGNDALLLWSIPGLTLYGFVAYVAMLLTLIGAFCAGGVARWGHAG